MITLGMDIGTRSVKAVVCENGNPIGSAITVIGRDLVRDIEETRRSAIEQAGIKKRHIKKTAVTGYGAALLGDVTMTVPDEQCLAAAGAAMGTPARTIIDIGGLFIRLLARDENGKTIGMLVNERCAAGSGKFLETVIRAMGLQIEQVSDTAARSRAPSGISTNCAVFAESEIITLINAGAEHADVIAGILCSIASKTNTMLERLQASGPLMLSGGLAKIMAFRTLLPAITGRHLIETPIDPQLVPAFGAALRVGR